MVQISITICESFKKCALTVNAVHTFSLCVLLSHQSCAAQQFFAVAELVGYYGLHFSSASFLQGTF